MRHPDTEFAFELSVCRWAELAWPPHRDEDTAVVVGRQLGTRDRRWDTVVVETTPEKLRARARFGVRELDSDLLHVVRNAPAEWAWYRDALPHPGYPWRYVRAAVHRAAARDLVEERRRDGRIQLRRLRPYPDWVDRVVAIENKPDLDASAARDLADQVGHDLSAGIADEVWVATERTGAGVEPVMLEDLPVEVGVLTLSVSDGVDADAASVDWFPSDLASGDAERDGERRRLIAERAYGRGWRSFHDTMRPDCRGFELRRHGRALLPYCSEKECHQTAAECSGDCASFAPEPPQWRTRGWPVEGGPGKGLRALLDRRRERLRDREQEG